MDLPRSSFYTGFAPAQEDPVIGVIRSIAETCRNYGYRRVTAELRHRGFIVNSKKVRRIMRENDLNPKRKRRYVSTTDSDHDSPIYPNVARNLDVHGPDQLWVGDITYIAISTGFIGAVVIKYFENIFSAFHEAKFHEIFSFLPDELENFVVSVISPIVGEGWHLTLGITFMLIVIFLPGGLMEGARRIRTRFGKGRGRENQARSGSPAPAE